MIFHSLIILGVITMMKINTTGWEYWLVSSDVQKSKDMDAKQEQTKIQSTIKLKVCQ